MQAKTILLLLLCSMCSMLIYAQQATLTGILSNENGEPVVSATVSEVGANNDVLSDSSGVYTIHIPANKKVALKVMMLGYEAEPFSVKADSGQVLTKNIRLHALGILLDETVVENRAARRNAGTIDLKTANVDFMPGPVSGVEGLLKILLGSNNELTSQYRVRGGNFDENLVYVNDFEIQRPFLVRSGQQEGLSFVNSDLVGNVLFSTGGFQAKYGDKMSSVLDVTYKRPEAFGGSLMLSLLGINAHLEGASRNGKLTYLIGARQKSNQYLLQSQPTKGQYNPSFTDIQALLNYRFNDRWESEIIANYARNRFSLIPERSEEAFGYVNEAYKLTTDFRGAENDQFDTRFVGWSLAHRIGERSRLKLLASFFQTNEMETYDIQGEYFLDAVQTDLGKKVGETLYSLGTGLIHDYARNSLAANVGSIGLRGSHSLGSHYLLWGMEGKWVQINDKLMEWERRDSAGFSQPVSDDQLNMRYSHHAQNEVNYSRLSAFIQDNILLSRELDMTLSIGLRATYSMLNDETVISPRLQYSVKPKWEKDIVFRLATGLYAQPPFYREMRDFNGRLNEAQKSQKSYQAAAGFDYNFSMWNERPFKLTFEAYYKSLWDLVPYEFDNVRIRYFPYNTAQGYAYGAELRLFGDLVKDAESWLSVGYLKTENRMLDTLTGMYGDYMPRPTDQRLTFGMFFSDYLPRNKNFKMFLNLMYATGLPFNTPGHSLEPGYQVRIPDYKRVDIGFAAMLIDGKKPNRPAYSFFSRFESVWLSVEVFNLLGIQNTLSYQWIQDYTSNNVFAVPNRLTSRLINAKLAFKF